MNEGDDLELSVLIEAYPHITKHRWDTPTSLNTATQENKLIRYNNRWTKIASWERNVQYPYSSFWYLSSTVRKVRKSNVLQEEEVLLNLRFAVLAFCVNLTRSLYFLRSWNSKREECCSLFISPMMHRSCLNSRHQISHFWFCRYSSFSPFIYFCFRYHAILQLKRMNIQEQGQYTFYAQSEMTNASITFQVQMYRTWQKHKLTSFNFFLCQLVVYLDHSLLTNYCFSPSFLPTGRETNCCREMGKCNHTYLHFAWLSSSQNPLVSVFWNPTHVSITAHKRPHPVSDPVNEHKL